MMPPSTRMCLVNDLPVSPRMASSAKQCVIILVFYIMDSECTRLAGVRVRHQVHGDECEG